MNISKISLEGVELLLNNDIQNYTFGNGNVLYKGDIVFISDNNLNDDQTQLLFLSIRFAFYAGHIKGREKGKKELKKQIKSFLHL